MSETPISPIPEQKIVYSDAGVEHRYYTGQVDRTLAAWEKGLNAEHDLDLHRDDPLNLGLWADAAPTTAAPEYAATPKTRSEAVEDIVRDMSEAQMREALDATSRTLVHGLRKYALGA